MVVAIEDTPYFHWQLPILLESVHEEMEAIVVLCSEWGAPSRTMKRIQSEYGVRLVCSPNPGSCIDIDASEPGQRYPAINRIEALNAVAPIIREDDLIFLAETDLFLFGPANPEAFPKRSAMQANRTIALPPFLQGQLCGPGINLVDLLQAMGSETPFLAGGVSVFLEGHVVQNEKFRKACTRFAQLLYLAGKIVDAEKVWHAEMACFALAMNVQGLPYELIDRPEFRTDLPKSIPSGTFYHYYHDLMDGGGFGAFQGEPWSKQTYWRKDFLQVTSVQELSELEANAVTDHARAFYQLAIKAKDRLYQ